MGSLRVMLTVSCFHQGCERRVIFDFIHVIEKNCRLNQALIKDKRLDNLSLLAASQTRDKEALTEDGVEEILDELKKEYDFILCDSPAGIESGARHAMYFADDAILVTNPEISSCRDSDKMIGFIASKSLRAQENRAPVIQRLLINRYDANRVKNDDCLSVEVRWPLCSGYPGIAGEPMANLSLCCAGH